MGLTFRSTTLVLTLAVVAFAQTPEASAASENDLDHAVKVSDDILWRLELGDIAEVRSFRYTGLPRTATSKAPSPRTVW